AKDLKPMARNDPRLRPSAPQTTIIGGSSASARLPSLQGTTCFLRLPHSGCHCGWCLCHHLLQGLSPTTTTILKCLCGIMHPVQGLPSAILKCLCEIMHPVQGLPSGAKLSGQALPSAVAPLFQAVLSNATHLHQVLLTTVKPPSQALICQA
ncbi:Hypothetical predicted protein, partial [Marmota monax]